MLKGKTTRGSVITEIMTYFGLIAAMLVVLFPFYVAIITSVKDVLEVRGPFTWWPHTFTTTAYKLMFDANELDINYLRALINTLTIAVPIVLFGCLSSSMSAYIFAKQEFLGKNMMFALMMTSMMVPSVVTLIPSYLIFTALGWVDTFLPLVVPGMFGSISVLFALRQFMCGIPNELTDAAKIDGLGYFGTYVAIILPLSYPPIIAQAIMIVSLFISVIAFVFAPFAPATAAKAEGESPDGETSVEGVFEMEKDYCVGLRLDENGGMRFIAKMDETVKDHIVNNNSVTLKFVIAPKDLMDKVTEGNYYGMPKKIVVDVDESKIFQVGDVGDYYYANGCVTNMQEANYKRNYTAVAVILNGENVERTTTYCGGELYGNYYDVANQAILYNENDVDYANTMLGLTTYDWLGSKDYPIKGGAEEYISYKNKADDYIALKNKYVSFGLDNNEGVTAEGDSLTFTDGGTQKILCGGNTANSEGFVLKYTTTVANGVVNGGVYFEMAQGDITYKYSMFIKNEEDETKGAMVQLIEYNVKEKTSTYYNFNKAFSSKIEDGDIKVTIICKRKFNNTSNRTCFSVVLNEGGEGKKVRLYEGWNDTAKVTAQPVLYKNYVAQDYKFGLVAYKNTSATFKDVSFALGDDVADEAFEYYQIYTKK